MSGHKWVSEEVSCDIDDYTITFCTVCGGHQGQFSSIKIPFLPGTGLKLANDCDESLSIVNEYKRKSKEGADKKYAHYHSTETPWPKRPIKDYMGWSDTELKYYIGAGDPPYNLPVSWYNSLEPLMDCNHGCPYCCKLNED